jgi:hypothetical protein
MSISKRDNKMLKDSCKHSSLGYQYAATYERLRFCLQGSCRWFDAVVTFFGRSICIMASMNEECAAGKRNQSQITSSWWKKRRLEINESCARKISC